jgi:Domain of unknown function (DUF4403)
MTQTVRFILCVLFTKSILSCSVTNKIESLKPEPDTAAPLTYDHMPSFVNFPISVKLKDVENQINKQLTGLIYEDNNLDDDNYTVKVWKLNDITLQDENGKMKIILPLKATINYRYGIDKLGIKLMDTREINLNGKINLLSAVGLTNWKLKTQTQFESLDWNESPTIAIAGKNMPITYIVNPALKIFKSKIERNIDEATEKSMDFKSNVLEALGKIAVPVEMNADYNTWLRVVPEEMYSTNAQLNKELIVFKMGLKCQMEALVGDKPAVKFDKNKIAMKPVAEMPNAINANLIAVSTYEEASKVMTKNFVGKEFASGNKKVTIQRVAIWHKNSKMVIELDLLGSINGSIYLSGFPQYNAATKEIYFDNLSYVLDTKNKLLKAANWLASGLVLKKIQENCRYSIKANLEEGKQKMQHYVSNYSPLAGVFVNGTMHDIEFKKIQLTNHAIVAFLGITGKINITVDGFK